MLYTFMLGVFWKEIPLHILSSRPSTSEKLGIVRWEALENAVAASLVLQMQGEEAFSWGQWR